MAVVLFSLQGAEIKKELGALAGLLVDVPENDDLKTILEQQQSKLKKLAGKLLVSYLFMVMFVLVLWGLLFFTAQFQVQGC